MTEPTSGTGGADPSPAFRSWPGRVGWLLSALVLAAAAVVALSRRRELAEAYHLITRVRLPGLAAAVALEAASVVCFAAGPRWLLRAGGVWWSLRRMTCATMAANALAGTLPGGAAFSAAWLSQYVSRRGAGQVLALAVLVAAGTASALSLFLLLFLGLVTAGPAGPAAFVRPVLAVLLVALAAGLVLLGLCRWAAFRRLLRRVWTYGGARYGRVRRVESDLGRLVGQARRVQPGLLPWLWPVLFALLNWTFDAACLAAGMWALGIGVPWRGLLLCYALTQVAGSLRLTPGNLGIAEATLSALLAVYGMAPGQAIAATFLYRIVSYWALQPIGWACWTGLTLEQARSSRKGRGPGGGRRGRRSRRRSRG
ncbi:YbhN family protein [Streptomyces sp. KHY 26]|uniref:lysylphosphatidylglycerol synthase transmembrane domain-containing protein n=1 Tax=Streptomyces sp. KHY 26 TaxID=3097359 RepID=UPI00376EC28B